MAFVSFLSSDFCMIDFAPYLTQNLNFRLSFQLESSSKNVVKSSPQEVYWLKCSFGLLFLSSIHVDTVDTFTSGL